MKIFRKKEKSTYLTGPSPKARPSHPPPSAGPAAAHAEPMWARTAPPHGEAAAAPPHIRRRPPPACAALARRAAALARVLQPRDVTAQETEPAAQTEPQTVGVDLRIPASSLRLPPRWAHICDPLDLLSPFCISPKPLAARNSMDLMRQFEFVYLRSSCPCVPVFSLKIRSLCE
jgi:hypothetical protein